MTIQPAIIYLKLFSPIQYNVNLMTNNYQSMANIQPILIRPFILFIPRPKASQPNWPVLTILTEAIPSAIHSKWYNHWPFSGQCVAVAQPNLSWLFSILTAYLAWLEIHSVKPIFIHSFLIFRVVRLFSLGRNTNVTILICRKYSVINFYWWPILNHSAILNASLNDHSVFNHWVIPFPFSEV